MITTPIPSFKNAAEAFKAAKLEEKGLKAELRRQEEDRLERKKQKFKVLLENANDNINKMLSAEYGDPDFFKYLFEIIKNRWRMSYEDKLDVCGFPPRRSKSNSFPFGNFNNVIIMDLHFVESGETTCEIIAFALNVEGIGYNIKNTQLRNGRIVLIRQFEEVSIGTITFGNPDFRFIDESFEEVLLKLSSPESTYEIFLRKLESMSE
jgi:hypothetical protein